MAHIPHRPSIKGLRVSFTTTCIGDRSYMILIVGTVLSFSYVLLLMVYSYVSMGFPFSGSKAVGTTFR
eukprot:scaffold323_cov414-Prasinococcus_capsulatus_cf.AAC.46